ncbi:FMN-binding protein [Arthrobacter sp. IA7]|uniref:FMN-binding protein n=1 Tax=Arthrobacter ipis TaxID=2716202 RepID=UPI00168555CA|nr:FMN-binding protein [Arthrobacter ipis]MBD1542295.1 FMN-binding protein [Arthrobacter ipis]
MRIRAAVSAALASAGILLVGWQSGVHVSDTRSAVAAAATGNQASGTGITDSSGAASSESAASSGTTGNSGTTGSSGAAGASGTSGAPGAAAKAGGTYDGDVVQTRFGTVQVQITVKAGQITDVTALKLTDAEGRSVQISNYAAPVLRDEVLQAQSADVQTVGGATVTSDAYLTSLQAALDAANL